MKSKKIIGRILGTVCLICLLGIFLFFLLKEKGEKSLIGNGDRESVSYQGEEYVYRDDIINILCLGIDNEEQLGIRNSYNYSVGQADAIVLVSLDTTHKEIRIIAIPRDTMVTLHTFDINDQYVGEQEGQITLQYAYSDGQGHSCELMEEQVSHVLCDIPIHQYVAVNLSAIPVINDAVGGVTVTINQDYTYLSPEFVQGRTMHLDGEQALSYVHRRNTDEDGSAYDRIERLTTYMKAFVPQAKDALKKDLSLPFAVIEKLEGNLLTNLSTDKITYLVSEIGGYTLSEENIWTVPGKQNSELMYEEFYVEKDAVWDRVIQDFYFRK